VVTKWYLTVCYYTNYMLLWLLPHCLPCFDIINYFFLRGKAFQTTPTFVIMEIPFLSEVLYSEMDFIKCNKWFDKSSKLPLNDIVFVCQLLDWWCHLIDKHPSTRVIWVGVSLFSSIQVYRFVCVSASLSFMLDACVWKCPNK